MDAARRSVLTSIHAIAILISCWLLLQAVHEAGHVIATIALGGHVDRVVLHPLERSRTERSGSASPLVDTWAGPLVGCLIPALCLLLTAAAGARCDAGSGVRSYARMFLGLCLVANGVYLGAGWSEPACDAGELLALGVPVALLISSGAALAAVGLWALSPMGAVLGYRGEPIGRSRSVIAAVVAAGLVGLGFAAGLR